MKILFNTRRPEAASSSLYENAFRKMNDSFFYDYGNYGAYDVVLFMSYEDDYKDLVEAKNVNKNIVVGLVDPRHELPRSVYDNIDFIVVDSIEMKDFFLKYSKPVFVYYEYPEITKPSSSKTKNGKVIIGYHGNKVHLESMYPRITGALNKIGENYDVEFWAIYNVEKLGKWEIGVPDTMNVKHIQWSESCYSEIVTQIDIGIVPSLSPIYKIDKLRRKSVVSRSHFLDADDDYLIKYKVSTGPGRLIVFSLLGIPVVSDICPSSIQFLGDGERGYCAYSTAAWYDAIERLVIDEGHRVEVGLNGKNYISNLVCFSKQNEKFSMFLKTVVENKERFRKVDLALDIESIEHSWNYKVDTIKGVFSRIKGKYV